LWGELLEEQLQEFSYLASMAGLHCDFSNSNTGVELHVSGYNHKSHVLLQKIVDTMLDFEIPQELFERIKDKISKQYCSFLVAQPYQHAIYGGDQCLEHIQWSIHDKIAALEHVSREDVVAFSKQLFKRCTMEGLVHGNVTADEAKQMSKTILDKIQPITETHQLENRVVQLEDGASYLYRFAEFSESNTNSCVEIIFQMGPMEHPENATLAFLHHLIREPAFNQLRTEEQLGYIVHTSIKTSGNNIKALLFLIQSDSFDPIHMEGRVEVFLEGFRSRMVAMSPEDFQKNIDAVVASFLEKVSLISLFGTCHDRRKTNVFAC
jgi:insulysin